MSYNKNIPENISSSEALTRLIEGNQRFVNNTVSVNSITHEQRRLQNINGQSPYAIILSCSDSRVPSEIVFDQGLGDLFIIRVAGNVVAPSIIGSIEFAASTFGTQLVVVMGHTNCGAVSAALDIEQNRKGVPSENIRDIINRILPSIKPIVRNSKINPQLSKEIILKECIQANTMASINEIRYGSKIIESLIENKKLAIVGAEYSLETGKVTFFEDDKLKSNKFSTIKISESLLPELGGHKNVFFS